MNALAGHLEAIIQTSLIADVLVSRLGSKKTGQEVKYLLGCNLCLLDGFLDVELAGQQLSCCTR
jgi:hypothetical protein